MNESRTLAAGVIEVDFEFVAFDDGNRAVAKLALKDAQAEGNVVATLDAKGGGAGAGFRNGRTTDIRVLAVTAALGQRPVYFSWRKL